MSESDIAFQLSELYDRWWSIHQWWVSVSFGLIAVAHFAGDKLNYVLAGFSLTLYAAFSIWLEFLVRYNIAVMGGFYTDLRVLRDSGQTLSNGARMYLEGFSQLGPYWDVAGEAAKIGTFLGVISYVIYSVLRRRLIDQ
jgi:hypothetical protein